MVLPVEDALARYRFASEKGDVDALTEALTDDVELVSPISGRMVFRGKDDVRVVLGAVYGSLRDLRWTDSVGEGERRVMVAETRVGPIRMTDAMVLDLAPDGRIRRMAPHLRPWLALTLLAALLGPKVGVHPGVMRRALGGGRG
jgi:SnoaL-like domain